MDAKKQCPICRHLTKPGDTKCRNCLVWSHLACIPNAYFPPRGTMFLCERCTDGILEDRFDHSVSSTLDVSTATPETRVGQTRAEKLQSRIEALHAILAREKEKMVQGIEAAYLERHTIAPRGTSEGRVPTSTLLHSDSGEPSITTTEA